jgi:ribosomal protein S18 acetylase RimI-like enzyme
MKNLVYREITGAEAYAFTLSHEFSLRDSSDLYIPDTEAQRQNKTAKLLEKLRSPEKPYLCLAVFSGEEMVASHFLHRMELDHRPACHIHGLWVQAEFRKLGIARRLKTMGEEWARAMGCQFMDSNVRITNRGMIALNESMGYEVARLNFRKPLG